MRLLISQENATLQVENLDSLVIAVAEDVCRTDISVNHILVMKGEYSLRHTKQDVFTEALADLLSAAAGTTDNFMDGAVLNQLQDDEVVLLVLEGLDELDLVVGGTAGECHKVIYEPLFIFTGAVGFCHVLH